MKYQIISSALSTFGYLLLLTWDFMCKCFSYSLMYLGFVVGIITCGQGGRCKTGVCLLLGCGLTVCGLWIREVGACERMTDVCLKCDERYVVISHKRQKRVSYRLSMVATEVGNNIYPSLNLPHFNVGSSHIMLCAVVVLTKYRLDGVLISKIDPFMYIIS